MMDVRFCRSDDSLSVAPKSHRGRTIQKVVRPFASKAVDRIKKRKMLLGVYKIVSGFKFKYY